MNTDIQIRAKSARPYKEEYNMTKQNSDINLLKFLFSITIVLLHIGMEYGYTEWQGSWIAVEWFFIFAGYTMTAHIYKTDSRETIGTETAFYVIHRIGSFFPYMICAAIVAFFVLLLAGQLPFPAIRDWPQYLSDPLLVQMFGYQGYWYIGVSWFLSSLWAAIAILFPVIRRFRGTFDRVYAFLIPLFFYGYMQHVFGYIWQPEAWATFCTKGMMRGIAGICLGAVSYNIGLFLKRRFYLSRYWELGAFICYAFIFIVMYKLDDSVLYSFLPFVFALLIAINMNCEQTILSNAKFFSVLGKISMVIFLTHSAWITAMHSWIPDCSKIKTILIAFVGTIIATFIVYTFGRIIAPLWDKLFLIPERGKK